MEAFEAIHGRRSIRKFTHRPVDEELLAKLIKAAMAAPSARNEQPWHFVVIDDRAKLDDVPRWHEYAAMMTQAPVAVAVCADTAGNKYPGFWVQDCSAAIQNLLIAAHAAGLGAVWLGVYPIDDRVGRTRELLGLPGHVVPVGIIALGHPAEHKPPNDRYDPARLHRNQWSP